VLKAKRAAGDRLVLAASPTFVRQNVRTSMYVDRLNELVDDASAPWALRLF